jgi:hypothetical protein
MGITLSNTAACMYANILDEIQYINIALGNCKVRGPIANPTIPKVLFSLLCHNEFPGEFERLRRIAPESMKGRTICGSAAKRSGNHKAPSVAKDCSIGISISTTADSSPPNLAAIIPSKPDSFPHIFRNVSMAVSQIGICIIGR